MDFGSGDCRFESCQGRTFTSTKIGDGTDYLLMYLFVYMALGLHDFDYSITQGIGWGGP